MCPWPIRGHSVKGLKWTEPSQVTSYKPPTWSHTSFHRSSYIRITCIDGSLCTHFMQIFFTYLHNWFFFIIIKTRTKQSWNVQREKAVHVTISHCSACSVSTTNTKALLNTCSFAQLLQFPFLHQMWCDVLKTTTTVFRCLAIRLTHLTLSITHVTRAPCYLTHTAETLNDY